MASQKSIIKSSKRNTKVSLKDHHHGKLFKKYIRDQNIAINDLCESLSKSYGWVYNLFRQEVFNQTQVALICLVYNLDSAQYGYDQSSLYRRKNSGENIFKPQDLNCEDKIEILEQNCMSYSKTIERLESIISRNTEIMNLQAITIERMGRMSAG